MPPTPALTVLFPCFIFLGVLMPTSEIIIHVFVMLYIFPLECKLHAGRTQPILLSTVSSRPVTVLGVKEGPSQINTHLMGLCKVP